MNTPFFRLGNSALGRNQWWTYLLCILLVISGIIGFGSLPLLFVLKAKGHTIEAIQLMTNLEVMEILGKNVYLVLQMLPFILGLLLLFFGFRYIHHRPLLSFISIRKSFDLKRFFFGFFIAATVFILQFAISFAIDHSSMVWSFEPGKFVQLVLICLFLVPLQTGFEEILFRGHILQWTGKAKIRGIAVVIINGLLFGAIHAANPEVAALGWPIIPFYIFAGIFACLITVMDDGLELSWGFHTANNFMVLLVVSNNWQVLQTDALFTDTAQPVIGYDMLITLFVAYPLMVLLFASKYKWKDWKQKLFS